MPRRKPKKIKPKTTKPKKNKPKKIISKPKTISKPKITSETIYNEPITKFIPRSDLLSSDLTSLDKLDQTESSYVTSKLNTRFHKGILSYFKDVSESTSLLLQQQINSVNYQTYADSTLDVASKDLVNQVKSKNTFDKNHQEELDTSLSKIPPIKVSDELFLNESLKNNPIFVNELRTAKIREYSKLANLEGKSQSLEDSNFDIDTVNEVKLEQLVHDKTINEKQAKELANVIKLGKISDDNFELVKSLQNKKIASPNKLASWTGSDWKNYVTKEKIPIPKHETPQSYGDTLSYNFERAFPSQHLLNTILEPEFKKKLNRLDSVNPLLKDEANTKLVDNTNPVKIRVSNKKKDTKKIEQDLEEVSNSSQYSPIHHD